jgi:hypothetical protein
MSEDYLQEIQKIRELMQDRSRFLSLSGLSGILAGIYALLGAAIAFKLTQTSETIAYNDLRAHVPSDILIELLMVAMAVFISALITALYFTHRKAKKHDEKVWNKASFNALKSFCIPFFAGGIFVIMLIVKSYFFLIAPSCLIFYGVALYSASHYTFRDIGGLGVAQILVGLTALYYDGYGFYFWIFGFGILHIIYGTIMYFKYEKD